MNFIENSNDNYLRELNEKFNKLLNEPKEII